MKSIEALHDEALSLVPDTAGSRVVNGPTTVTNTATTPQDSSISAPKVTSADAPSETAGDRDIMARIDDLLHKLDEDDDISIAPLADDGPRSSNGNMTGDVGDTGTADAGAVDNPSSPDSIVLSNVADHSNKNAILDVTVNDMSEDTADKPVGQTGDNANDEIFVDDQAGKTIAPNQAQALADIAAAIYQARQQAVDTPWTDASQNNTTPFNMDALSTTIADEVRRTITEVIITELPQMVRDAVGEAIRSLPADARGQSTSITGSTSKAKSTTARKTAAIKKSVTKKAKPKKPIGKKATSTKARAKKTAPLT